MNDDYQPGDVVWGRIVGLCFVVLAILLVGGLADLLGLIS